MVAAIADDKEEADEEAADMVADDEEETDEALNMMCAAFYGEEAADILANEAAGIVTDEQDADFAVADTNRKRKKSSSSSSSSSSKKAAKKKSSSSSSSKKATPETAEEAAPETAEEATLETAEEATLETAEEATLETAEEATLKTAEEATPGAHATTLQAILEAKRNSPPRVPVPPIEKMMEVLVGKIAEYQKKDVSLRSLPDMVHAVAVHFGLAREHVEPRTPLQKQCWENIIMLQKTRAELALTQELAQELKETHRHRQR